MSATQKTKVTDCPKSTVLLDYIQGRLNPPVLDECEAHVADCDRCHETLRTLDPSDTLSEKVAEVITSNAGYGSSQQDASAEPGDESQHRINRLIGRLTSREFLIANGGQTLSQHGMTPAESELLADRAAEVLRYVEEESTGTARALGRLGDYRLLNLIGAGSTGVVFQALDISLDRLVALKVLRPSLGEMARQRFLAEARSAASIEHVNVVTIFQVGQVGRLAFMAMQWQSGQTLESKLRTGEQFSNDATRQIIKQIAAGLEAAHQKQVVHRDIKPANIWLCDPNDEVKILDFGLARIADDDPGLTATGMLAGTPNFMSPEQSRGLELDGRSDLFSLGCVMYQLLTGRLPFGAPTVLATLQAIQNDSPLAPQAIAKEATDELSDLTMGLLEKQPANRPQTAEQLVNMLGTARTDWPTQVNRYAASHTSAQSDAHTQSQTQPAVAGSASSSRLWQSVALLLIGGAAWWWSPQIIRIATDKGEVVIEANDDAVEIQVLQNGELIRVVDTDTQQAFDLSSGNYTLKAIGNESTEGAFEVTPNSLMMKRGVKQIVRVTHTSDSTDEIASKASGQGRAVTIGTSSNGTSKSQPIYQGKPFDQWLESATVDRDDQTRINSIEACTATVETDQQWDSLLALFSQIVRKRALRVVRDEYIYVRKDLYLEKIGHAIHKLPPIKACGFVYNEMKNGNKESRKFCSLWVNGAWLDFGGNSVSPQDVLAHAKKLEKAVSKLSNLIIEHLEEPSTLGVLNGLLRSPDSYGNQMGVNVKVSALPEVSALKETHLSIVGEVVNQEVPAALKRRVLSGTTDFRMAALPAIKILLSEDTDVLAKFEADFLSVTTTPRQRMQILNAIDLTVSWSSFPATLLKEKCLIVLRLLKSDLEKLSVAIPTAGGAPAIRTPGETKQWLVQILTGLQSALKGQGSAELNAEITAALNEAQPGGIF